MPHLRRVHPAERLKPHQPWARSPPRAPSATNGKGTGRFRGDRLRYRHVAPTVPNCLGLHGVRAKSKSRGRGQLGILRGQLARCARHTVSNTGSSEDRASPRDRGRSLRSLSPPDPVRVSQWKPRAACDAMRHRALSCARGRRALQPPRQEAQHASLFGRQSAALKAPIHA
jgi:hypothetical protein